MKNDLHINEYGTKQWYLDDKLHRPDGPAEEYADGTKTWWLDGKRHRPDGPAVERTDGTKMWWVNNKRHRTDGPAVIWASGVKEWHLNGTRLGFNDRGFWALWELLDDGQRSNLDLLMWLPNVVRP